MDNKKTIEDFKRTGSLNLLTRSIRYNVNVKVISDIIVDHVHGISYLTPKRKMDRNQLRQYYLRKIKWRVRASGGLMAERI